MQVSKGVILLAAVMVIRTKWGCSFLGEREELVQHQESQRFLCSHYPSPTVAKWAGIATALCKGHDNLVMRVWIMLPDMSFEPIEVVAERGN